MALTFQSLRSGSSANCLLLRNGETALLVDAGFPSQRACRTALADVLPTVDGVLISHLHGDHVHYASLRVLEKWDTPVYIHESDLNELAFKHFRGRPFAGLDVRPFADEGFRLGAFDVEPFAVPHYPARTTHGFEIRCGEGDKRRKVVVASDLADWFDLEGRFADADFIYVEANHDPVLLEQNWNPNSCYHLSNGECGRLLRRAFEGSRRLPAAVMLGHLSDERNEPTLAAHTVWEILDDAGFGGVEIHVAPADQPSEPIHILA